MAKLVKCTRCKTELDINCFSVNDKGEYFKSCNKCRQQIKEYYKRDNVKEHCKEYYKNNREKN